MGAWRNYFSAIGRTVLSLGDGLAVTTSYVLRKPVTIQYPDRTSLPLVAMLPSRSRGFLEVDLDLCTACALCEKTCPIDCIHLETGKDPSTQSRLLNRLDIDIGRCMFCGLCVEACPTGAVRHSREFEGSMSHVESLVLHFVDSPRPPAKPPKKDETRPSAPIGSIVRRILPNPWSMPSCSTVNSSDLANLDGGKK